jgi:deoxyribonuclease-4
MGAIRFGPAFVPSRERPEEAVEQLVQRGYSACEIDFEGGFWMDWDYAGRLGAAAEENGVALSIHAPIAAFVGHAERGKKLRMAVGMLDHTAGLARACGAAPVVFHPGFLLGRERGEAIVAVVEQLGELRERLAAKDRDVPFGVEVMGRVRELGSLEDVVAIAAQVPWVRPVIDFAHLHAVTDGGYADAGAFAAALDAADAVMEKGVPFHIHFSDISYANRNEKSHLPYGEGTLRAEPLAAALAGRDRPATVISESPDEASSQAIRAILHGESAQPPPAATPRLF